MTSIDNKIGYVWCITEDHINDGAEVGTVGPNKPDDELVVMCSSGFGTKFKMYDDDGVLYYSGVINGKWDGFEPLDDFGTPSAGCTRIKYQNAVGVWVAL